MGTDEANNDNEEEDEDVGDQGQGASKDQCADQEIASVSLVCVSSYLNATGMRALDRFELGSGLNSRLERSLCLCV